MPILKRGHLKIVSSMVYIVTDGTEIDRVFWEEIAAKQRAGELNKAKGFHLNWIVTAREVS